MVILPTEFFESDNAFKSEGLRSSVKLWTCYTRVSGKNHKINLKCKLFVISSIGHVEISKLLNHYVTVGSY